MTTRYCYTTGEQGYRVGTDYSDSISTADLGQAAICRVVVGYDSYITSLTVHYVKSRPPAVHRGGSTGAVGEVILERDEWVTRIEGSKLPNVVSHLKFVSNKGRTWGPFGSIASTGFIIDPANNVPLNHASHMGLLYFQGNMNANYILLLQATFAEYPGYRGPPELLKFEKQIGAESAGQSAGALSSFARQLMSPIVILRIGPGNTEFRAYEDVLCRLPLFRAALQGGFKEAAEKTITMPEEEPETISALIEFLYTGSYTYTFKPQELGDTDGSGDTPVSDVTQGSFHVAVYAVASKYDYQELVEGAVKNFTYVLKQLEGLDVIDLWKSAYVKGLYLSQFEVDEDLTGFMKGLQKLVGDVYRTHRDEMETMVSEYPALGSDLLRLVTTGGVA